MKEAGKNSEFNWLSRENVEYGDPDFGSVLAGKLTDLTSGNIGPGAYMHFTNVSVAYTHLYGFDIEGVGANAATVTRSGNQGAVAELRIPANAGLLRKAWNIVVGPELTWSADATTTDFASEAQAVTARNALAYYWRDEGVGERAKGVAHESMAFGEAAMHIPWDASKGEPAGVEQGEDGKEKLLMSGDMDFRHVSTWNILRDPTAKSWESLNWIVVREWPDKFDVAASCKTEEQRLAALSSQATVPTQTWLPFRSTYNATSDRIPVYYLYAKRSPSVPGGRQTVFLADGTVLEDGPLDEAYASLPPGCIGPVVPMRVGNYAGTPWPYSKWFATLGAGQANDSLTKDLLTNATSVSGNVTVIPTAAMDAFSAAVQSGGPQVVPMEPADIDKVKVLDLHPSHPEHFKLRATLSNDCQQIMGIDNITAGEEVGANLSGAAMALMTSTSVQNNSQEQAVWTKFVQNVGTVVLRHIQKHMKVPKRIALAGNARSSLVTTTEVSGKDIEGIQRVFCTIGSPLQQTDAGKYEVATTALKEKWAQTPEQFQTVLDTGRLDALTQDLSNELLLINAENEAIGKGETPPVALGDNHRLHLKLHRAPISSLTARNDKGVIDAQQAHEAWHIRILRETDPQILEALGQQPMAPAMPAGGQMAPGAPGAPPPGNGAPKPPQAEQQAKAPSLPTSPATGEKVGPVAGTPPPQLAVKPN